MVRKPTPSQTSKTATKKPPAKKETETTAETQVPDHALGESAAELLGIGIPRCVPTLAPAPEDEDLHCLA